MRRLRLPCTNMSLNVDYTQDYQPKEYVPFKYFVRPTQLPSSEASRSFTCFLDLPAELQLYVYDSCDASTLFNLMHTSSSARNEVSKRFWAHSDTLYCCRNDSYFSSSSRNPIIFHSPEFGSQITRVEIDMIRIEMKFLEDEWNPNRQPSETTQGKAQFFWARVQKIFPSVQTIILNGLVPNKGFPFVIDHDSRNVTSILGRVVRQAPSNLRVLVALQDNLSQWPQDPKAFCDLWQIIHGQEPSWKLVEKSWAPRRILLPERRFTSYPGGAFLKLTSSSHDLLREKRGLWQLRIDTYLNYSSASSKLHCLDSDCDAIFTAKDEWRQHLRDNRHHRHDFGAHAKGHFLFCEDTPPPVKVALMARCERVDQRTRELEALSQKLREDWGDELGSEKRLAFERAYLEQLEEVYLDPECQENKRDNLWYDTLHEWLTPEFSS